jgi:hypothetical protein
MNLKVLDWEGVDQDRHKWQAFVDTVRTFGLHKMRGTLDNAPSNFTGQERNIHYKYLAAVT